jgi:FkbM family methyltransferase
MLLDLELLHNKYNLDIKGVIHIGGHWGEEHKYYKKLNVKNIIYFEPLMTNFSVLRNNVRNEAICKNMALGSHTGEIKMFVESSNQGQSSSILKPKIHLEQYPHIIFDDEEIVKIDLLDNIQDIKENEYNFINIDVQGYELEVFKGAKETLNNIDYIVSEVNRAEVYENCPNVEDLDSFLGEYGFERVETSWDGYTWGDAFYVKKQNG